MILADLKVGDLLVDTEDDQRLLVVRGEQVPFTFLELHSGAVMMSMDQPYLTIGESRAVYRDGERIH